METTKKTKTKKLKVYLEKINNAALLTKTYFGKSHFFGEVRFDEKVVAIISCPTNRELNKAIKRSFIVIDIKNKILVIDEDGKETALDGIVKLD